MRKLWSESGTGDSLIPVPVSDCTGGSGAGAKLSSGRVLVSYNFKNIYSTHMAFQFNDYRFRNYCRTINADNYVIDRLRPKAKVIINVSNQHFNSKALFKSLK